VIDDGTDGLRPFSHDCFDFMDLLGQGYIQLLDGVFGSPSARLRGTYWKAPSMNVFNLGHALVNVVGSFALGYLIGR
jgi:fluoride ion exporter CrcB/FEX